MKFSANLGFLFTEFALPDAIREAKRAGFDAVELHWPYATQAADVADALRETNLPLLGLNTDRGDVAGGENGLCALPGRQVDARASIDEACAYAEVTDAQAIHVMAGVTSEPVAREVLCENLRYASKQAGERTILIEPLNPFDAPGYFYHTTADAVDIIEALNLPNLRLMFDCYHVGRTEGDVIERLNAVKDYVGHFQFASVPDRGPPSAGELDYASVFKSISDLGWVKPLGAEYKPTGPTAESLGWMSSFA